MKNVIVNLNRLKAYRQLVNAKQEDIAKVIGKTVGTYNAKENGKKPFELIEAKMIANYFNKPIDEIFFNDEVNFKNT